MFSRLVLIFQQPEKRGRDVRLRAISHFILAQNIFISISLRPSYCKRLYLVRVFYLPWTDSIIRSRQASRGKFFAFLDPSENSHHHL